MHTWHETLGEELGFFIISVSLLLFPPAATNHGTRRSAHAYAASRYTNNNSSSHQRTGPRVERKEGRKREISMAMEAAGPDLVDPGMFLRGCKEPLEQYQDCLMKNLKDWNGR